MPKKGASTTHHCPKKGGSEGNCRYNKAKGYCTKHQELCDEHDMIHLQDEDCPTCEKQKEAEDKK